MPPHSSSSAQASRLSASRSASQGRILIIEDDQEIASLLNDLLSRQGHTVTHTSSLRDGETALQSLAFDLVLLDLTLPDGSGLTLLDSIKGDPSSPPAIVLTGDNSLETAVTAVRQGAFDYVAKPFDASELLNRIRNGLSLSKARNDKLLSERSQKQSGGGVGVALPSPVMKAVYERIQRVAPHDGMSVLIRGETGVGKEAIAKAIHDLSPRRNEPFVAVNCANFERNLLQSELFGHEKGAFTGATERHKGLFELASNGTLFLDEVGEMPLDVQAAFLRVLETHKFRRLGGGSEIETNARILAATNRDLLQMSREGRFRDDLYYRLNTIEISIPPLRERPEDIMALAEYFTMITSRSVGLECSLNESALARLKTYPWPGNIRELKNIIDRCIVVNGGGIIDATALQLDVAPAPANSALETTSSLPVPKEGRCPTLLEVELEYIQKVLAQCGGNKTQAAEMLGIARNTLLRKLGQSDSESVSASDAET